MHFRITYKTTNASMLYKANTCDLIEFNIRNSGML